MPGPLNRRQLAGLGAVVVGGWAVGQVLRRTAPIGRDVGPTADLILAGNGSPEDGPADATLRLAVFTDYRCPACRHGFSALEEAVQRDGKVRVIYKDWPIFGPPSERAASVALACAEQGVYPTVHRALMTDSRTIDDDLACRPRGRCRGTPAGERTGSLFDRTGGHPGLSCRSHAGDGRDRRQRFPTAVRACAGRKLTMREDTKHDRV